MSNGCLSKGSCIGLCAQGMLGPATMERLGKQVVHDVAGQAAGLMPRDLAAVVADAGVSAVMQVRQRCLLALRTTGHETGEPAGLPVHSANSKMLLGGRSA